MYIIHISLFISDSSIIKNGHIVEEDNTFLVEWDPLDEYCKGINVSFEVIYEFYNGHETIYMEPPKTSVRYALRALPCGYIVVYVLAILNEKETAFNLLPSTIASK